MKVVILMAGLGTRLRPHTYSKTKALLPVAGKPVLAHLLDRFQGLDVEEYIFIVGYLAEQIEEYVEANYDLPVRYVLQAEPLGQAHALHLAREYIDGPFLMIFVDTIFEADLTHIDEVVADGLVFVKEVDDPRRFGIALLEGDRIVRFIEKPEEPLSNLALVGMYYVANWPLFKVCVEELLAKGIMTKGEYYIADAFQLMVDRGAKLEAVTVDVWQDCGKPETLLATNRYLLERGGTEEVEVENSAIIPPVSIAEGVTIRGSVVGPYVSAAEGSVIIDSMVKDSIIDEGARIEEAMLTGSLIGANAQVKGKFKRLDVAASSRVDLG
jgi:glucose-1-phosphate thymidylyltransferase